MSGIKIVHLFVAIFSFALIANENFEPNVKKKYGECITLVKKAVKHIKDNGIAVSCKDFSYNPEWKKGEIYVFVIDAEGILLCDENLDLIWKNISLTKNLIDEPLFDTFKNISTTGTWINHKWNRSVKATYVQKIKHKQNIYYVCAGFFPQTKEYIAEQLVETAALYFQKEGPKLTFIRMSDPRGSFVIGDVTTYACDFEGNIVADGREGSNIGRNLFNYQDSNGNYIIRNLIKIAGKKDERGWLDINWSSQIQRNYVKQVISKDDTKKYFLGGKFYVHQDKEDALQLIEKAIEHIKKVGAKNAFIDFSNPIGSFVKGNLTIFAYDLDGKNLADGEYPVLVGSNLFDRKDSDGNLVVAEMVKIAKQEGQGTILSFDKNSYKELIIKTVTTPEGTFIIGSSVYRQSKMYTVIGMVNKAIQYAQNHTFAESLKEFKNPQSEFIFGDVSLFISTMDGVILLDGLHRDLIGKKLAEITDDAISKKIIDKAQNDGGWIEFTYNNAMRKLYVKTATIKRGSISKKYIIGSGYYV